MTMFKNLKEDRNKTPKDCENIHGETKERMKTVQDTEMEIESLKETQSEIKLETENLESRTKIQRPASPTD